MTALSLGEAVRLGYVLVARLARDSGVRVLAIKGPVAVAQDLREPHNSVDVDVLVDPSRVDALVGALGALGWEKRPRAAWPTVLGHFAETLWHPAWACELDVHTRFPGLMAPPQAVFDELWVRRAAASVAGQPVECPAPADHAVIVALNVMRDLARPGHLQKLNDMATRFEAHPEVGCDRLVEATQRLGGNHTMRPLLTVLGAAPLDPGPVTSEGDLQAWAVASGATSGFTVAWLKLLLDAPWRSRPAILWRAIFPPAEMLRPDSRDSLRRHPIAFHLRRIRRGLRALPSAWRAVKRAGRAPG